MAKGVSLAPLAGTPRFPWAGPFAAEGAALGPVDPVRAAEAAARALAGMLAGIVRWQRHPHRRRMAEPPVLWRKGSTRLLDYGGTGPVVLAVPSLVNRAYVLDLSEETSLLRHLARAGCRVLLLDWGVPGPEEAGFGIAAYHADRLAPALDHAAGIAGPVALLGYCVGGTLALAAAALDPQRVARLALIGAPWDFGGGRGVSLSLRGLAREAGAERMAELLCGLGQTFGAVPADLLQALFALLDPGLALAKFRRFAALDPGSAAARRFVELEDWLNDPVPLPGPAAAEMLVDWQVRNVTGRGLWRLSGETIRPERLRLPVLAFCSTRDRIAPAASTEPLALAIPGARLLRPGTGHVGMIVGSRAREQVWSPLADFLAGGRDRPQDATG